MRALLLAVLLPGCVGEMAGSTAADVPRNGRGEPVLEAVRPLPPATGEPAAKARRDPECQHYRHC